MVQEQQTILRKNFERNLILDLKTTTQATGKDVIQVLYSEGLLDSLETKDSNFEAYLTFTDEYLLERYGTEIKTSDGVYSVSDLGYSKK